MLWVITSRIKPPVTLLGKTTKETNKGEKDCFTGAHPTT